MRFLAWSLCLAGLLTLSPARAQEAVVQPPPDGDLPGPGELILPVSPFGRAPVSTVAASRLGANLEAASPTLADQLDLPNGRGIVLKEVKDGSAAAKAGLKPHDILLEVDGKPVPSDLKAFDRQLKDVKEDAAVTVTVMRKGKTETIKEVKLPKGEARASGGLPDFNLLPLQPIVPLLPDGAPMLPFPILPGFGPQAGNGVTTTVFRAADRFTARHQEGSLIITLTGQENKVKQIKVQDGRESHAYETVEKVPDAYRDKVKNLVEMIEKASVKVEIKGK